MSLDQFFNRKYSQDYFCLHHTAEVWKAITGEDIFPRLHDVLNGLRQRHLSAFTRLARPESPCLVLMRHPRRDNRFHMGVFIEGRIMHFQPWGAQLQPADVVIRPFDEVRWYR